MAITRLTDKFKNIQTVALMQGWGFEPTVMAIMPHQHGYGVRQRKRAYQWCKENCKGKWKDRLGDTFYFERDDDAAIFWVVFSAPEAD